MSDFEDDEFEDDYCDDDRFVAELMELCNSVSPEFPDTEDATIAVPAGVDEPPSIGAGEAEATEESSSPTRPVWAKRKSSRSMLVSPNISLVRLQELHAIDPTGVLGQRDAVTGFRLLHLLLAQRRGPGAEFVEIVEWILSQSQTQAAEVRDTRAPEQDEQQQQQRQQPTEREEGQELGQDVPYIADNENALRRWPMHCAAANPAMSVDVLSVLHAAHGGAVRQVDVDGRLPLHVLLAVEEEHPEREEIARFFVTAWPEALDVRDTEGRTPLDVAVLNPRVRPGVVQVLHTATESLVRRPRQSTIRRTLVKTVLPLALQFQTGGHSHAWFADATDAPRRRVLIPACAHLSLAQQLWTTLDLERILSSTDDLIFILLRTLRDCRDVTTLSWLVRDNTSTRATLISSLATACEAPDSRTCERLCLVVSEALSRGVTRLPEDLEAYALKLPNAQIQLAHHVQVLLVQAAARVGLRVQFDSYLAKLRGGALDADEASRVLLAATDAGDPDMYQFVRTTLQLQGQQLSEDTKAKLSQRAAATGSLPLLEHLCNTMDDAFRKPSVAEAAAVAGHLTALEWLEDRGANDVDATSSPVVSTAKTLERVLAKGHLDIAKWLLAHNVTADSERSTAATRALAQIVRASPACTLAVAQFVCETMGCSPAPDTLIAACTTHNVRSDVLEYLFCHMDPAATIMAFKDRKRRRIKRNPEARLHFLRTATTTPAVHAFASSLPDPILRTFLQEHIPEARELGLPVLPLPEPKPDTT